MASLVFLVFLICLAIGLPIVTGIGIASIWPKLFGFQGATSYEAIIRAIFGGADSTPIIAVPLFILAGVIMARGGISKKIFNVVAYFIGNKTAGMPCAVVITCLFYGAISGSGPATVAAVGGMTLPILINLGYDKVFSAALVATAGSLGVIIPPSIPFVLYGTSTSSSVGSLFIAGIFPGILIGLLLMGYAYFYCKRYGEDKEKILKNYNEIRSIGLFKLIKESFWALLSPLIILGGIYSGYFTPTEAACMSVFYSVIVSLYIYKTIKIQNIWNMVIGSVKGYAPLIFILASATAFGRVLALLRAPQMISEMFANTFSSTIPFLFVVVVFFFILGMFMDTGPAIVIMAPILVPTLDAFNISLIHFGVIMVCCLAIGLVTPPFGLNLFVAAPMIDAPVMSVGRKSFPLIAVYTIALLLITFIPAISLFLLR